MPLPAFTNNNGSLKIISFILVKTRIKKKKENEVRSSGAERMRMHLVDNFDNKHITHSTTIIMCTMHVIIIIAIQTNGEWEPVNRTLN